MSFALVILLLFPAILAFAAAMDLFTMTIPNWLPIGLVVGFAVLVPFVGLDLSAIAWHVGTGILMLAFAFSLFAMNWIGGGDAKLFAATSLWIGHAHLLEYIVATAFVGGALTLALVGLRMIPLPAGLAGHAWIARLHERKGGIPYGIALAGGGLLTYPHTIWMTSLAG